MRAWGGGRDDDVWSEGDVGEGWEVGSDEEMDRDWEGESSEGSVRAMSEGGVGFFDLYGDYGMRVGEEWGDRAEESRMWREWEASEGMEGGRFDADDVRRGDEWMRRYGERVTREV